MGHLSTAQSTPLRALCLTVALSLLNLALMAAAPGTLRAQDRPRGPSAATAVPTPPEEEEDDSAGDLMLTLYAGEEAPFDGTLFSVPAAARLLADLELTQARCDLEVGRQVRLTEAQMQLRIDTEHARLEALELRHSELIRIRDQQIEFLTGQLRPEQWYESGEFWFVVGVVGGVLLTVAAGFAVGEAN